MKAFIVYSIFTVALLSTLLMSCVQKPTPVALKGERAQHSYAKNGSLSVINIVSETPELPEHKGKDVFINYCGICHSLQYILIQPKFTKKVWEDEVHKMVEKYGAPISPEISTQVVDYIMALQAKEE